MRLYNTLTRHVEDFVVKDYKVNMYVCGITPYAPSHLGHAMCAVVFDIARRYLEFRGFYVRHIQNFTDIDDKMIVAASDEGIEVSALAERNIRSYLEELNALNVLPATEFPRATEEIESIIEIISGLIQNGFAYEVDGDVYFRVRNNDDYGKLSNRNPEDLIAGARLEVDEIKEYPGDFALWKSHKKGEPAWGSPWGKGRPGWHIECSAMSITYLNESIDIHGGGLDLVFPHHENEIAQSESFTGVIPFAKFWMHNGTLQYGDDKMSKSIGNVFSIENALKEYSPDSLRMFFLSSHYRNPLTFTDDSVQSQSRALDRLKHSLKARSGGGEEMEHILYRHRFIEAMDEDLNTPRALAVLFDLARDINRESSSGLDVIKAQKTLAELSGVLGLTLSDQNSYSDGDIAPFVEMLINVRSELREVKQFELADNIREKLFQLGISLEDTEEGTIWRLS
ncbi:MAG: cysteine--tRNA ligase [Chloroflexi bacterium]|nr:cysteine--tRNA ligase [Chloroflexota bacterium]|tara:strand:+ start:836 stop:2194 length:1359 start_codon:yes stop_codon:yes gene_type:complete